MSETNGTAKLEPARGPAALPVKPRRRYWLYLAAAVVMLLVPGFGLWYGLRDTSPKDDFSRLQGEWRITPPGGETDNGPPPNVIRIEGDRWVYVSGGRETSTWRFELKPDAAPKELNLIRLGPDGQPMRFTLGRGGTAVEQRQLGLYALDGDTLTLALAPEQNGRPKSLDDPDAPALTLTRVEK